MRKKIIAGNWKMNTDAVSAANLIKELIPLVSGADKEVVVCPPYINIPAAVEAAKGTNIAVGAQNMHWEEKGAYTGEVSAQMLVSVGVKYVIIGHSERRQYFGESDGNVNKKVKAALAAGLTPIVCVGETLGQREADVTADVVNMQVELAFEGIENAADTVIAYEPVWAIGTGKTATSAQANEVCALIRAKIEKLYGTDVAGKIRIQYGGSMNDQNAEELLAQSDIDGGLIGGAALVAEKFAKIVGA